MALVEIVTIVIGTITVGLLITLLVLMRTLYVLVRRERGKPTEPEAPRADLSQQGFSAIGPSGINFLYLRALPSSNVCRDSRIRLNLPFLRHLFQARK